MADGRDNLIVPTSEQARENGRKGGLKRAENARQKKALADTWDAIRDLPMQKGRAANIEKVKSLSALRGTNLTVEQAVLLACIQKTLKTGDARNAAALFGYFEAERTKEATRRKLEAEIDKLELERARMELELRAYEDAVKRSAEGKVVIVDDIPGGQAD